MVTDSKVLAAMEKIADLTTKMEFKVYPPEKEAEARAWLK